MIIRFVVLTPLLLILLTSGCAPVIVGGVGTGVAVVHDRRPAGVVINDQEIRLKILGMLQDNPAYHGEADIGVTSYNQKVLLTGSVPSAEIGQRLVAEISQMPLVKQVWNELQVRDESNLRDELYDSYLTSRVKLALLNIDSADFDATRVKVVTAFSTVYLMGLLTPEEINAVTEAARKVPGVKRVVRLFETPTH
ncbi:MAG TPA: BON domain-containing protein [Chromatiaceae bacterium]|nr:BON domain-containing protein [Chromatiaceae bacterium]